MQKKTSAQAGQIGGIHQTLLAIPLQVEPLRAACAYFTDSLRNYAGPSPACLSLFGKHRLSTVPESAKLESRLPDLVDGGRLAVAGLLGAVVAPRYGFTLAFHFGYTLVRIATAQHHHG